MVALTLQSTLVKPIWECALMLKVSALIGTSGFLFMISSALTHGSSWKQVDEELDRARQVLINNGYSSGYVEGIIKRKVTCHSTSDDSTVYWSLLLKYSKVFSTANKMEEMVLKNIIDKCDPY